VLASVKLDGTDRRVHMRWQRAGEVVVSPDGRWVAFNEAHDAYVTALPQTPSQTIEVSLEGAALPLAKLTDDLGEWVNWADRGRTLTWVSGPTYHRIALDKALPTPETEEQKAAKPKDEEKKDAEKGKDAKSKLPESQAIEIVLRVPRARPTGTVAYVNARIVTLRGDEVIENGTILVRGDRIEAVGPSSEVAVPRGAQVVSLPGRTVIPGLFDEHAHLHYSVLDVYPQRPWKYLANLAYGVTTTHDPSASSHEVFGQAEMVEAGLMTGPRIYSTGFILYGADDPDRSLTKSLEDARKHVRRMKRLGAHTVKSYMQPAREQRQWIIQAAREESIMVVPEGGGDQEMDMTMILDGHTTIEHALPIAPLGKDVVTLFSQSGTAYTPTLLVAYGGFSGDQWFYQHYDVWKDERLLRYVPPGQVVPQARVRSFLAPEEDWHHVDVARGAKQVMDAGGTVCLGGHGQMQGLGPHWELWAFVQGGMTPAQALHTVCQGGAKALGMDRDLGSIEPGMLADFVVLEKNPLEDIHNSTSVERVIKNGVEYSPKELERKPTTESVSRKAGTP
jgi:imidazolonepropionase-like amidohydrolase